MQHIIYLINNVSAYTIESSFLKVSSYLEKGLCLKAKSASIYQMNWIIPSWMCLQMLKEINTILLIDLKTFIGLKNLLTNLSMKLK